MHCNLTRAPIGRLLFHVSLSAVVFLIGHNQLLKAQTLNKTSSVAQTSSDWDRYTLKEGEFSVLLPQVPAMTRYSHSERFSKSQQRNEIGVYSQGVVYAIHIFDVKQSLDEFIAAAESRFGYARDLKRELRVSGILGKEYAFENEAGRGLTQLFLLGHRLYVFRAQGARLGNPDVGIPRFFESLRFERSSEGRVIIEGPGDLSSINTTAVDGSDARVFTGKEVMTKSLVITKPAPTYTDDARENQTTGTVVLRCVFSSSGAVTNIRAVSGLPNGLTEKAIGAARQIKFIPAIKDGRFVSMWIQLEYNFNLY